jgi:methyltransferase family protein
MIISMLKTMLRNTKSFIYSFFLFREKYRQSGGKIPIFIDYPIDPQPRYGHGKPPHKLLYDIIDHNRDRYAEIISQLVSFRKDFDRIPAENPEDLSRPYWHNGYFSGLKAMSLYGFLCQRNPQTYLEIGSGNSTAFAKQAIRDYQLQTKIISIDPHPRQEIDALCDKIIRRPLECTDLSIFGTLGENDILVFDGSHRCFTNSDVTVFFLEILPALPAGLLVYIDDIFLPYDYPPDWNDRFYSEQYLLATLLTTKSPRYQIHLPIYFTYKDEALHQALAPLANEKINRIPGGVGFWLHIQ